MSEKSLMALVKQSGNCLIWDNNDRICDLGTKHRPTTYLKH